jgi:hypothetical protein
MTLSYVIIVPIFLLGLMVVAQAGVWYLARSAALAAARQGADAARVDRGTAAAGPPAALSFVSSAAHGFLTGARASDRESSPQTIVISVSGAVPTLVPGMHLHVSQVVQAPVERFTTP